MGKLVLVRHGESEWNALDIWTGWTDVGLTTKGEAEASAVAKLLKGMKFDICYTSDLKRAIQTLEIIKRELGIECKTIANSAIKERDYGDLTAMKRSDVVKKYGYEQFMKWRRGWDFPVPGGETLKDVYNRVVPYYRSEILPRLAKGQNILIVAHGNSLRALIKYLDRLSDKAVTKLEMLFNQAIVYSIDANGKVTNKEILSI